MFALLPSSSSNSKEIRLENDDIKAKFMNPTKDLMPPIPCFRVLRSTIRALLRDQTILTIQRTLAMALLSAYLSGSTLVAAEPIDVGPNKQLFIDGRFVEANRGASIVVNRPRVTGEKLIVADKPWENLFIGGYTSVIEEGDQIQLWYEFMDGRGRQGVAYACSKDHGATWIKPELGLIDYEGSRQNNIVILGLQGHTVFKNRPDAPAHQKYGMFIGGGAAGRHAKDSQAFYSADGLHWTPTGTVPFLDASVNKHLTLDSQNVIFWDTRIKRYVIYARLNIKPYAGSSGVNRVFGYANSATFGDFGQFKIVFQRDDRDPVDFDWYTTAAIQYPYAQDAYFMWPAAYHKWPEPPEGKLVNDGPLDIQFAVSRDGVEWQRSDRRPVIPLGLDGAWDSGSLYAGYGFSRHGDELSLYYTGYPITHGEQGQWLAQFLKSVDDFRNKALPKYVVRGDGPPYVASGVLAGIITRAIYRLDGFMSIDAPYEGADFNTPAILFAGDRLEINFEGSAGGWAKIEILDEKNQPIPGFTMREADKVSGNSVAKTVSWTGKSSVAQLKGRPIKLRFVMRDAKLYAFQFVP